jgi:hypothetical protein
VTTDWTDDEPAVPLPPGPGLSGPGAPYPGVVDERTGPTSEMVRLLVDEGYDQTVTWIHEPEGAEDATAFDVPAHLWKAYRAAEAAYYDAMLAIEAHVKPQRRQYLGVLDPGAVITPEPNTTVTWDE